MNEYLKLADEIEKISSLECMDLDKVAALWVLHSYITNGIDMPQSPSLIKRASEMLDEEDMALHLGVELALKEIMGGE